MSGLRCPACGLVNFASSETCRRCGRPLSGGIGITTGGLPVSTPLSGYPPSVSQTEQTHGAGQGTFGTPQPPPSASSYAQPSGSFFPTSAGSFSEVPSSLDANPQPPLSDSSSPIPPPGSFGQVQPAAPFGSAPFSNVPPPPAGAFGGVPPYGGFIPTPPPGAGPYAAAP